MEIYYKEDGKNIDVMRVDREDELAAAEYIEEHVLKEEGYNGKNLKEIVNKLFDENHPTDIAYYDSEKELDEDIKLIKDTSGYKKL